MPLTIDTIKVGMHVKCIYDGYGRLDKTAKVVSCNRTPYIHHVVIEWDDGHDGVLEWGGPQYFEEVDGPIITYVQLTSENVKVGLSVKETNGRIGSITNVQGDMFTVLWEHSGALSNWWTHAYFQIIVTGKTNRRKRKHKKVTPDFPIDTSLPLFMAGHLQDRQRKRYKVNP